MQMSEEEIKGGAAQELLSFPSFAARAKVNSVEDFVERAAWVIIERNPKARLEADSEYDMVKYEAIANLNERKFSVLYGACRNVINVGQDNL
jgi:hypothetical protein